MLKILDQDVSTVSTNNDSEGSAKKNKFLASFVHKVLSKKTWAG